MYNLFVTGRDGVTTWKALAKVSKKQAQREGKRLKKAFLIKKYRVKPCPSTRALRARVSRA